MRRIEKEIKDHKEFEDIFMKAQVCRLALCYESMPYIVPMCFGYQDQELYFHSAQEGLKLMILRENSKACFEIEVGSEPVPGEKACSWTMRYQSIIGFGEVEFIENLEGKREGLRIITKHYTGSEEVIGDEALSKAAVFKLKIHSMTGKKSGY